MLDARTTPNGPWRRSASIPMTTSDGEGRGTRMKFPLDVAIRLSETG